MIGRSDNEKRAEVTDWALKRKKFFEEDLTVWKPVDNGSRGVGRTAKAGCRGTVAEAVTVRGTLVAVSGITGKCRPTTTNMSSTRNSL
ncbi:Protein of unknown function [Gryllus bimaculatus]|nr:Protein of unknown function [Gryllus bimaculatus]